MRSLNRPREPYSGSTATANNAFTTFMFRTGSLISSAGHPKRRASVLHHHRPPGPATLLPSTLPTLSTFTWSDLRSPRVSLDTDEEEDDIDRYELQSIPTDNATMSHRSKDDQRQDNSVQSGVSIFTQDAHRGRASAANALLSPQRSPSPPEHLSQVSFPLEHKEAFQTRPIISLPLPPPPSSHPTSVPSSHTPSLRLDYTPMSSNSGYYKHENGMVSRNEHGSSSRPGSIQLPSPPDSPPYSSQPQAGPHSGSLARSRSTRSYSQTSPQGPPDYRFNPSRFRPPLTNTQSSSTALPFRPNSHSGHSSSLSIHALPSSSRVASAPAQSSTSRSGMGHHSSSHSISGYAGIVPSAAQYPTTTTSPPTNSGLMSPRTRARSGSITSVASEMPVRTNLESRVRPTDMHRRASISTNPMPVASPMGPRSPRIPPSPVSPNISVLVAPDTRSTSQAYARTPEPSRGASQYEEPQSPPAQGTSHAYYESSDLRGRSRAAMTSSSSLVSSHRGPSPMSSSLHPSSASRHPSRGPSSSHPAYVKKKDSPALRPLPTSPFLYSPPQSPPARSRSGTTSSGVASPFVSVGRSRAGSIMTLGEPPLEGSEGSGSIHESEESGGVDRRRSSRATLPPIQPISPLDFETSSFAQAYERHPDRRKNY